MDKRIILLVEDNEKLNDGNRRALEGEGFVVYTALTLAEASEHLTKIQPDVILLDVVLPDGNGFDFCAEIQDITNAHIIFLTSRAEHDEKLRGLSLGDDYITKPFKLDELLLRVAAAVRRRDRDNASAHRLTKGELVLDIIAGRAMVEGTDLLLTQKEFSLLLLFAQNENISMNAEYLYEKVWGQQANGSTNAVKYQVSNLRKKLEGSEYIITSTRGEGYRFERE